MIMKSLNEWLGVVHKIRDKLCPVIILITFLPSVNSESVFCFWIFA